MNVEIRVFTYQNKFLYLVFPGKNHNQYQENFVKLKKFYFPILNARHRITHHYYQYLSNKSVVGCRGAPVIRLSFVYNIKHRHKHKLMKLKVFF